LTSTLAFWTAHFCVHTCSNKKKIVDAMAILRKFCF